MTTRTASCRCGALRAICEGEPVQVSVCHCLECQRRSGSAFAAQARRPDERRQGHDACVTAQAEWQFRVNAADAWLRPTLTEHTNPGLRAAQPRRTPRPLPRQRSAVEPPRGNVAGRDRRDLRVPARTGSMCWRFRRMRDACICSAQQADAVRHQQPSSASGSGTKIGHGLPEARSG
jgi:hypothetical protein